MQYLSPPLQTATLPPQNSALPTHWQQQPMAQPCGIRVAQVDYHQAPRHSTPVSEQLYKDWPFSRLFYKIDTALGLLLPLNCSHSPEVMNEPPLNSSPPPPPPPPQTHTPHTHKETLITSILEIHNIWTPSEALPSQVLQVVVKVIKGYILVLDTAHQGHIR